MTKALSPILGILASATLYAQQPSIDSDVAESRAVAPQTMQNPLPLTCGQGDNPLCCSTPCYNYPGAVKLKGGYDVSINASYLYWYAGEEGLDLATTTVFTIATNTAVAPSSGGAVITQDFSYASAFKVGLDFTSCCDIWVWSAEYTRYHHNTALTQTAPAQSGGIGSLYLTDWFYQTSAQGQGLACTNISSQWKLDIDWVDFVIQRPFYSGSKLILNPFFGLKAAWIDQTVNLDASGILNFTPPEPTVTSNNSSNSWGLGPRAGLGVRYILPYQIRIQALTAANLLYTKYTQVAHSEGTTTIGGAGIGYSNTYGTLRPSIEARLGMGWGYYSCNQRIHLDLNASYDFTYLWSQNVIRYLNDLNVIGIGASANNLYLHGLTVTAALDF